MVQILPDQPPHSSGSSPSQRALLLIFLELPPLPRSQSRWHRAPPCAAVHPAPPSTSSLLPKQPPATSRSPAPRPCLPSVPLLHFRLPSRAPLSRLAGTMAREGLRYRPPPGSDDRCCVVTGGRRRCRMGATRPPTSRSTTGPPSVNLPRSSCRSCGSLDPLPRAC